MLRGEVIEIPAVRVGDVGPQSGALSSFERITTNISCESLLRGAIVNRTYGVHKNLYI